MKMCDKKTFYTYFIHVHFYWLRKTVIHPKYTYDLRWLIPVVDFTYTDASEVN